jgi:hypothetical protein
MKKFFLRRGSPFYVGFAVVSVSIGLAIGLAPIIHRAGVAAEVAAQMPTFEPVARMHGVVINNAGTNLLGFHWVTFERDDDKVPVTGLSKASLPIGTRARLMEATMSLVPGGLPSETFIVLPEFR